LGHDDFDFLWPQRPQALHVDAFRVFFSFCDLALACKI
jgi:hypothetical protein